jgi:hypothetical protein
MVRDALRRGALSMKSLARDGAYHAPYEAMARFS